MTFIVNIMMHERERERELVRAPSENINIRILAGLVREYHELKCPNVLVPPPVCI